MHGQSVYRPGEASSLPVYLQRASVAIGWECSTHGTKAVWGRSFSYIVGPSASRGEQQRYNIERAEVKLQCPWQPLSVLLIRYFLVFDIWLHISPFPVSAHSSANQHSIAARLEVLRSVQLRDRKALDTSSWNDSNRKKVMVSSFKVNSHMHRKDSCFPVQLNCFFVHRCQTESIEWRIIFFKKTVETIIKNYFKDNKRSTMRCSKYIYKQKDNLEYYVSMCSRRTVVCLLMMIVCCMSYLKFEGSLFKLKSGWSQGEWGH